jgi:hypothetical protein
VFAAPASALTFELQAHGIVLADLTPGRFKNFSRASGSGGSSLFGCFKPGEGAM